MYKEVLASTANGIQDIQKSKTDIPGGTVMNTALMMKGMLTTTQVGGDRYSQ